ncbi:MAG: hypothetical protein IT375_28465 [Polyangiaceae bacterium]|mgnify:FL=1|nr:hypothetical protein [Polyangiaceae bacterium]
MSERYLLDANAVIPLQRTGQLDALVAIGAKLQLLVVEEVYDELCEPRGGKLSREAAEMRRALDGNVTLASIEPESAASARFDALKARKRGGIKSNLGEAASVAWAADHDDVVFVTRDAAAAFLALNELGSRVTTFFQLIREAVELGALAPSKARLIGDTCSVTSGVEADPPLWWNEWLVSKSS